MLIEERYKDEDTGSDGANSLPKLELSYSAGVCFFLLKQVKKDNYQLENKEIKNLPPNLKKNHFLYERKQVMYLNLFLFSLKLFSSFTD
ncbi:hypothetical protein OTH22_05440 [Bacteroides fragilis]|nr:hypothetical protein [Bacteroides fragilis]MCM0207389.1 hypothetical protein [Bacteroides fragilis]MCX8462812.1 hypothetical protein [Bacteroides fragilis]